MPLHWQNWNLFPSKLQDITNMDNFSENTMHKLKITIWEWNWEMHAYELHCIEKQIGGKDN